MTRKAFIRLALGAAVAALFIYLIARQLDGKALVEALKSVRPGWLLVAVVLFFAGYAARIMRWRAMLRHENPALSWASCATPFLASIALNNVLPLRAGDVVRAFGFSRALGVSTGPIVASLLVERLLDVLTLLALLGLLLLGLNLSISALIGVGAWAALGIAAVGLLILLFPRMFLPFVRAMVALLGKVAPGIGTRAVAEVDKVFDTLVHLSGGGIMAVLVGWSIVAWTLEASVFFAAAQAVGGLAHPVGAWLAMPVGTLATILPSTPGYIGTFDFFVMKAMEAVQNQPAPAAAFALVVHLVLWLPVTAVGGIALMLSPPRRSELQDQNHHV